MSRRHLPVRPNLDQLKHQAKDLLRAIKRGDADAIDDLSSFHPDQPEAAAVTLSQAQFILARSYGLASWPRLVLACRMTDAICRDDVDTVRQLVTRHPALLSEDARGVKGNWGPPMSYAANLGRDRIIRMLRERGADDVQYAFDRACLQGQLETARLLHSMGARPVRGSVMGPCETLNSDGLRFLFELGAELEDENGNPVAPIGLILETYCRNPEGKHQCLELIAQRGVVFPDTASMAVHRGRLDLLERCIARDPDALSKPLPHEEMFPVALGCHADPTSALGGTPVGGATLLHMAIDFDELEIARWLVAHGADVNGRALVDADGFGGYTPLFCTVVIEPDGRRFDDVFARLLLDHGADPNIRASLRKQLMGVDDETMHEYRDVTALSWGQRFHDQQFVSKPSMALIVERGGRP
jgi:ankyrin repeat protein